MWVRPQIKKKYRIPNLLSNRVITVPRVQERTRAHNSHICDWRPYCIYRVIREESVILWEMIVCVILSKKVHMNMGPILDGYGVMTA